MFVVLQDVAMSKSEGCFYDVYLYVWFDYLTVGLKSSNIAYEVNQSPG